MPSLRGAQPGPGVIPRTEFPTLETVRSGRLARPWRHPPDRVSRSRNGAHGASGPVDAARAKRHAPERGRPALEAASGTPIGGVPSPRPLPGLKSRARCPRSGAPSPAPASSPGSSFPPSKRCARGAWPDLGAILRTEFPALETVRSGRLAPWKPPGPSVMPRSEGVPPSKPLPGLQSGASHPRGRFRDSNRGQDALAPGRPARPRRHPPDRVSRPRNGTFGALGPAPASSPGSSFPPSKRHVRGAWPGPGVIPRIEFPALEAVRSGRLAPWMPPGPSVMPRSEGVPPSIEEWRCAPSPAWQLPALPPQQPKPAISGVALPFHLPALQVQRRVAAGFKVNPAIRLEHLAFAEQRQRLGQQP